MKKQALILACIAFTGLMLTSCVSKKKFQELENEKEELAMALGEVQKEVKMLKEQNDEIKAKNESLNTNLNEVQGELTQTKTEVKELQARAADLEQYKTAVDEAFSDINSAMDNSTARIAEIEDMLYLDLDDTVNFQTGSAVVDANDKKALEEVAEMLKNNPKLHLIIEGHTDVRSINTGRYKDNWDLSVDRAVRVVRELVNMGVDPNQLTAAGRGEYMPAIDSDNPRDSKVMEANRRTEFMLVPKVGKLYKVNKKKS